MSEIREDGAPFVGYEYLEIPAGTARTSLYLDGYENFGWTLDERTDPDARRSKGTLVLKRDRKILNKMELTRLQRHFAACVRELDELERSKTAKASVCAFTVGIFGTAFLAGSTFAVVHEPPYILLTVLLAIPWLSGMDFAVVPLPADRPAADENRRGADGAEVRRDFGNLRKGPSAAALRRPRLRPLQPF